MRGRGWGQGDGRGEEEGVYGINGANITADYIHDWHRKMSSHQKLKG